MNGPAFWSRLINDVNALGLTRFDRPVVAGGAVRDWFVGREPNDIDIFIGVVPEDVRTVPPEFPAHWQFNRTVGRDEYPNAGDEFNVHEYIVEDTTVQLMLLRGGFQGHYIGFDYNMTKAWYSDLNGVRMDNSFVHGLERKRVWRTDGDNGINDRMMSFVAHMNDLEGGWALEDRNPIAPIRRAENAFLGLLARPVQNALEGVPGA